jgi:hypothetical protein
MIQRALHFPPAVSGAFRASEAVPSRTTLGNAPYWILSGVVVGHLAVIGLMALMGELRSAFASLILSTLIGLVGIYVVYHIGLRRVLGSAGLYVLVTAYLFRVGVGVVHYLAVMDPEYFAQPSAFTYIWDYEWMHVSMVMVSDTWRAGGFFTSLPQEYWLENKNPVLLIYGSLVYYLNGVCALNVAPWNSLHTIYTACLVAGLAYYGGANRRHTLLALGVAAFEPFGIISSVMWRDSMGQLWVVLGVYLVIITRHRPWICLPMIVLASALAYSQRTAYVSIIVIGSAIILILLKRMRGSMGLLMQIGALGGAFLVFRVFGGAFSDALSVGTLTGDGQLSFSRVSMFGLLGLRAIMGPFPWFHILNKPSGFEFMPTEFAQVVVNLAIFITIIPMLLRQPFRQSENAPATVFGLLLFASGTIAFGVHTGYVSIGMVLLVPLACRAGGRVFSRNLLLSFGGFCVANILYAASGLYGSGSIQGITGY